MYPESSPSRSALWAITPPPTGGRGGALRAPGRWPPPRGGGAGWGIPPEGVWSPEWGVAKIEKWHPENLKNQKTVLPKVTNTQTYTNGRCLVQKTMRCGNAVRVRVLPSAPIRSVAREVRGRFAKPRPAVTLRWFDPITLRHPRITMVFVPCPTQGKGGLQRSGEPYWGVAKAAKARGQSLKPARTPKGVFGSVAQLARALAC